MPTIITYVYEAFYSTQKTKQKILNIFHIKDSIYWDLIEKLLTQLLRIKISE